jgi:hypothetical protein
MLNPFVWLRSLARAAVVNGVQDALFDVTPEGVEPPADLAALQERLAAAAALPAAALPAAEEEAEPEAPVKRTRK